MIWLCCEENRISARVWFDSNIFAFFVSKNYKQDKHKFKYLKVLLFFSDLIEIQIVQEP